MRKFLTLDHFLGSSRNSANRSDADQFSVHSFDKHEDCSTRGTIQISDHPNGSPSEKLDTDREITRFCLIEGNIAPLSSKKYFPEQIQKGGLLTKRVPQNKSPFNAVEKNADAYRSKILSFFSPNSIEKIASISAIRIKPCPILVKDASSNLLDNFEMGHKLGEGSSSIVRLITRRSDSKKFALKSYKEICTSKWPNATTEAMFLRRLDHPKIIKFEALFSSESKVHVR